MANAIPSYKNLPLKAHYDVIVLGSGLGGATCALRLGERGLKVLLVERGGALVAETPSNATPASRYILDEAPDRSAPLNFVGGQTKFFGAALYRLREADFLEVRHEAGVSPAWPISYADLAPFYEQAERIYKVHGSGVDDPTEPKRTSALPFSPVPFDPLVADFAERLSKAGAIISALPRAVDYGAGGRCVNCSACDAHFCVRDGKMDAEIAAVRPALKTGFVQLATHTYCTKLSLDMSETRVNGCHLVQGDRETFVEADCVVTAAGMRGTAELFLRSRTNKHPNGLGNQTGQLGRNLAGHSTGMVFPIMGMKKLPPVQTKSFAINTLYHGSPDWPYPMGVIQLAGQMPFWRDASRLTKPAARIVSEHCFTLFHMTEAPPSFAAGFVFEGDRVASQIEPPQSLGSVRRMRSYTTALLRKAGFATIARRRPPYLWHEVGTSRMGSEPTHSVVDPFGQVHGLKGLFVADAGVLPTAGAVNTGLTIAALALRTADYIASGAAAPLAEPATLTASR